MDDCDKYLSVESKKYQYLNEDITTTDFKNVNKPIGINDIIEVCNEDDKLVTLLAKVLQIKENPNNQSEKLYYVHYLDFEKRMDRWIDSKSVLKNHGANSKMKEFNGSHHLKFSTNNNKDGNVLTRKRSYLMGNNVEQLSEKEVIENSIKIKNIEKIIIGYYEINTWYYSPYPSEFTQNKILFICEFCLKYMKNKCTLIRHYLQCKRKSPPGKEIYRQEISIDNPNFKYTNESKKVDSISIFEINGSEDKLFCQNLCLLAKLFLDHKSIYFDVSPFKFYVLTENDKNGKHIVSYFSKENSLATEFNLACIMVLPPYQRKGYGQFLINMSYYYSKAEKRICTPETPLSDLGKISYKSYWTIAILETLLKYKGNLSIKELSEYTGIKTDDIIYTLNELSMIKYWKGQQVIQFINAKQIEEFLNKKKANKIHYIKFNPKYFLDSLDQF